MYPSKKLKRFKELFLIYDTYRKCRDTKRKNNLLLLTIFKQVFPKKKKKKNELYSYRQKKSKVGQKIINITEVGRNYNSEFT